MIPEVGQAAVLGALMAAAYSTASSLAGARVENTKLMAGGRYAAVAAFALLTAALGALAYQIVALDSGLDAPFYFKLTSVWSSEQGSFLVWGWFVTMYAAVVAVGNRGTNLISRPYATAILMSVSLLFTLVLVLASNPFDMANGQYGAGLRLNPLLQDWRMLVHPPLLFLGFSGFFVPFAFTMAALLVREPNGAWRQTARRWALIAWLFLGAGILFGANWAYRRLGWGGFWAWDPVENGALMPWLIAAAYVHSIRVQQEKDMLKTWNVLLSALACVFSIFGGFLSRSGVVASIHGFARSPVAAYLLALVFTVLFGAVYLIFKRWDYLKAENRIESFLSREVLLIVSNLMLLGACFAVLWGTMIPPLSEWITGVRIGVHAPWFNWVIPPIGIALLCLMGAGSWVEWRRTPRSLAQIRRSPAILGGHMVHFGFLLLFIGVAGQAFKTEAQFEARIGETFQFRQYVLKLDDLSTVTERNYTAQRASLTVFERGRPANTIHPEQRFYFGDQGRPPATQVALWPRPTEDLYLVLAGSSTNGERAVFLAFLNPLMTWIWIGGAILIVGALIALLPSRFPSVGGPS